MEGNYCTFPAEEKIREPKDRWHGVYFVFYYTGLAILFPYTMLITVTEFWNYKWRNVSLPYNSSREELTEMQKQFPNQVLKKGQMNKVVQPSEKGKCSFKCSPTRSRWPATYRSPFSSLSPSSLVTMCGFARVFWPP